MQPLNYTGKAIADFRGHEYPDAPLSRANVAFLIEKLEQAETFVLGDSGQLLDRGKPRAQVPASIYRPPFPVVALEYSAAGDAAAPWREVSCSKRISLAWHQPAGTQILPAGQHKVDEDGVVIASICFNDAAGRWLPVFGGYFLPYETSYSQPEETAYRRHLIASGRISSEQARAEQLQIMPVIILPEVAFSIGTRLGQAALISALQADMMDEANAYLDLCMTLACKNVRADKQSQPEALQRARARAGKVPLKDFYVLTIDGQESLGGVGRAGGRTGPRPHLRRGHVRRLGPDRMTWVNSTMVRGRGAPISKQYSIRKGSAA